MRKIIFVRRNDYSLMLDKATWEKTSDELEKLGFEVICYFETTKKIHDKHRNVQLIKTNNFRIIKYIQFIVKLFFILNYQIIKHKPDLVVLDILTFYVPFPAIFFSKNTKYIIDYRTFYFGYVSDKLSLKERVYKSITIASLYFGKAFFDGFSFIVPEMKEFVNKYVDLNRIDHFFWSSGVSPEVFKDSKSLNITRDKVTFFYHGHITSNRGLENAIVACKPIWKQRKDFQFILVGDGPFKKKLKDLILENGLEECCLLNDPVPYEDIKNYISASDIAIMVYPNNKYWNYNNPIKLIEYLFLNKFVVLTNIPAFIRVIGDSPGKLIINDNNVDSITEVLSNCINSIKEIRSIDIQTSEFVASEYTWAAQAKKIAKFINSAGC